MKKIITSLSATAILTTGLMANGELTGDIRLACEAILCLSSGTRPTECTPSLTKFFSIVVREPWKTIQLRKNFLKLCPTDQTAQIDENYDGLIETLSHLDNDCDANTLNSNLQNIQKQVGYRETNRGSTPLYATFTRINPDKPKYCNELENHKYGVNHQTIKYTCSGQFYPISDWRRGYELKQISQTQFNSLEPNLSIKQINPDYAKCSNYERSWQVKSCQSRTQQFLYFQKIPINKKCWVDI